MLKLLNREQDFGYAKTCQDFHGKKDFMITFFRRDEDMSKVVDYILMNPVRAGIVDEWREYQFVSSTVFDLNKWS